MNSSVYTLLSNPGRCELAQLETLSPQGFHDQVLQRCQKGARLGQLLSYSQDGAQRVLAVLMQDDSACVYVLQTEVSPEEGYPSLTRELASAQAFERALFEDQRIVPQGHPWLKPLRKHRALESEKSTTPEHPFYRVEGPGIHEVAVGPVHAGIIEPGHFRFQCSGETVHSLEIHLGYQHRGLERMMVQASPARQLILAESVAGDTAIGHALAFCMTQEALCDQDVPLEAQNVRAIALEFERLANHVGDLGMFCNDVGYLPGASWFGRLRGEFLNLLLEMSGNRFGRGLLIPGGVRFGLSSEMRARFAERLRLAERDLKATAALMFDSPSVLSRYEQTGVVSRAVAEELGLVGPAARACGCNRDVRRDHPHGLYRYALIPIAITDTGDVMARALVRWLEVERSLTFILERLSEYREGTLAVKLQAALPGALAVSAVEGWRGEIVHCALTDALGSVSRYAIVDPSLHNWFGLAMALRGNQISDFPLCNKSFNLSYAGHDL